MTFYHFMMKPEELVKNLILKPLSGFLLKESKVTRYKIQDTSVMIVRTWLIFEPLTSQIRDIFK